MRVDWFRVLADLQRAGFSLKMLHELTGIPRSTLGGYRTGSEPGHYRGEQLLAFWCAAMKRERHEVPMERAVR